MRIGTLDWGQAFGGSSDNNRKPPQTAENEGQHNTSPTNNDANQRRRSMVSSSSDASSATPRPTPLAAPGSGAPGSGVPGAGTARGSRTVLWKGKSLNMDTTRTALAQAAADEQRVAQEDGQASGLDAAASQSIHEHIATILTGMNEMCGGLQEIYASVSKISERETNNERVFNTLHAELSDYKKDFIYEHLKPVIRPLLFLYDSLEQFEGEVKRYDSPEPATTSASGSGLMPTRHVKQNTVYFREQLVEALRICEVTQMDTPEGAFNPRFHKAARVVPVDASQDNTIQRVIRSGWFLNGQLLRPAEVVVGKAK